MRGATYAMIWNEWFRDISTHTPHAGRDEINMSSAIQQANFYSHAPCGARLAKTAQAIHSCIFLLTRPMRGATAQDQVKSNMFCISTHTPHAGRDRMTATRNSTEQISTHTPHAGRDT